jgi:DNA repair protein RadC
MKVKQKVTITSPRSVYEYFKPMAFNEVEVAKVLFLNSNNGIIGDATISTGTVNTALINPREVLIKALKFKAVQIILAHNHPSDNTDNPSHEDIEVTKRLKKASELIGITLLDSLIIGRNTYFSMKESGHME